MAMFKEIADIKTADMLNLPSTGKQSTITLQYKAVGNAERNEVASLTERAEQVRGGGIGFKRR